MRVSEDARKCTVFLGEATPTKANQSHFEPEGTGFLVYAGHAGQHGLYIVTAAHVARRLGNNHFDIRLNDDRGGARLDHVDQATWHYHSKASVDVAIMKYVPPDWADGSALPASEFMNRDRLEYYDVGPGDAAYIVGLFHFHSGKSRNLIVVHNGNIAMMPTDEKIPVKGGTSVEGYLVESQALPGASGSPVYVRPTLEFRARARLKKEKNPGKAVAFGEGRDYLLGVWIAAWPGITPKRIAKARGVPPGTWIPVGMGIVVPAKHVSELVFHPDRIRERNTADTDARNARAATLQSSMRSKRKPKPHDELVAERKAKRGKNDK